MQVLSSSGAELCEIFVGKSFQVLIKNTSYNWQYENFIMHCKSNLFLDAENQHSSQNCLENNRNISQVSYHDKKVFCYQTLSRSVWLQMLQLIVDLCYKYIE